ncbi:MAG: right-handed parallel beta-helix repeat-containing protein [Halioglobus sp.]|nr:right-handed parallel beta-helix repeat-containing protein [Halioglobus sp.]
MTARADLSPASSQRGDRTAAGAGPVRPPQRRTGVVWALCCALAFALTAVAAAHADSRPGGDAQADTAAAPAPGATLLRVGPQRWLKTPSAAAGLAQPGDTIEIDAGLYLNDYAVWQQDNLTIRGVGGMAHLQSDQLIPNGKAIWIVSGNNTVIESVEFSGARVVDTNGAGIRHEGGNLTLRDTYFHHNEFSVLTGPYAEASLEVVSSRFYFQKREGTFSHGIYVGGLGRFTVIGSHFKGTDRGHQIKSRALENRILYNRIEDTAGGNSSRLVDLPNCGLSYIIGNDMHQAASTENVDAIGYGAEGCEQRTAEQHRLFVINNTFVNEAAGGTLVRDHVRGDVLVANNLLFGDGDFLRGPGAQDHNVALRLADRRPGSWAAPANSQVIDAARALAQASGFSLLPLSEFQPPLGTVARRPQGTLDIGAHEASATPAAPGATE